MEENMSQTVFITGANRGLGLEFVNQLSTQLETRVVASCRDINKAEALRQLSLSRDNISMYSLDVAANDWQNQLDMATASLSAIDLLILNAGVFGDRGVSVGNIDQQNLADVFHTNAFAPLLIADHLIEKVVKSNSKLIVAITSRMGSIGDNTSGGRYAYRGSKAALNAMMVSLAKDVEQMGVKVLLLHPGWVKTSMGGDNAYIDAETSVSGMLELIDRAPQLESGSFLAYDGRSLPF